MKKATMETIISLISSIDTPEAEEVRQAINAELSKNKAKAEANRTAYAVYHDKVISALQVANAPVTAHDLAEHTGIAQGKIVYGLNNYWSGEVVKDNSDKVTTYRLA